MSARNPFGCNNFSKQIPASAAIQLAILALFDYMVAFPSTFHAWISSVLEAISAPWWIINVVRNMYRDCSASIDIRGEVHFLFVVVNAVLQSCPLSSVLFNFVIDPLWILLWIFSSMVLKPNIGKVFACADDIAAILFQLRYLMTLHSISRCTRNIRV